MMIWAALTGGVLAGVAHVLTGPDHVSAVFPLAVSRPGKSLSIGAMWGVGHGFGTLLLGLLALTIGHIFDVELASHGAEALVGFLLIGLGVWSIRRSRQVVLHTHEHGHEGSGHAHPHLHVKDPTVSTPEHASDGQHDGHTHSAFGFGLVHGLAGAGHLFAAAPLVAFGLGEAGIYIAAYLLGGVATMSTVAALAAKLIRRPQWIPRGLVAAGAMSIAVGLVWVAQFTLA